MPKGNLVVHLSDMAGELAKGHVDINLKRVQGAPGAGGANMIVSIAGPVGALTITGIPCQTGPGTSVGQRPLNPLGSGLIART